MSSEDICFIVGPRKTATTWLYDMLLRSEDTSLPRNMKETFFFDRYFYKGLNWFERLFNYRDGTLRVEVAPSYFSSDLARQRMCTAYPNAKIVICLRDPVKRCLSDYLHHLKYGHTKSGIIASLKKNPDIIESSKYSKHVPLWELAFKGRVLVVYYEDFLADKKSFLNNILDFLNIDSGFVGSKSMEFVSNEGGTLGNYYVSKMSSKIVYFLNGLGLNSIVRFFKTLGVKRFVYGGKRAKVKSIVSNDETFFLREALAYETECYFKKVY
jgi:hypothetical protein